MFHKKMEPTGRVICSRCNKEHSVAKYATLIRCTECKTTIPICGQSSRAQGQYCNSSRSNVPQSYLYFKDKFKNKNSSSPAGPTDFSLNTKLPSRAGSAETHPRKRALLCGVTYQNKKYRLKGTINDVNIMKEMLINQFHYPPECIRVLTEEDQKPGYTPTKKNIQVALKWLVEGSEPGDSLVFFFSGHGLRQPDFVDDERDGYDETICPVDFMQEGMILDNEINSTIVRPLKKGVTLHAIVDACHSGTILDLEYVYNRQRNVWDDNRPPSKAEKSTSGGLAICLSACGDDQMAADTSAFTGKTMAGAMTYILIDTVKNNAGISYGDLLNKMHDVIEQTNNKRCLGSKFLQKVFRHRRIQDPLLSSSEEFDVHSKKFGL